MMMDEMEYLKLPTVLAKAIQHPEDYIKKNDPKEPIRRIFKTVPISQEERKLIQQFKENLNVYRVEINPESQTDEVLLRFIYACQLNLENAKEMLRGHLSWLREPKNYEFDQDVLDVYNKGVVYIVGRDKQYRPTLIINCEQITSIPPDLITRALSILCIIMEDFCFYDGRVENWNIILDLKEKCVLNVKLQDYYKIFQSMYQNFPCTVDKIFILHPSMSVQLAWSEFMEHVPNRKKIIFVTDYNQFKKYYEPTQLERKYGGRIELKKYFPPYNALPEGKQLTEPLKLMETLNQQQLTMMPTKQSIQGNINLQEAAKTVQPLTDTKFTKSKINRDFSVYPQEEVCDFKVYRPTQTTKEPIKNISKYNRITQASILRQEYEYQAQQTAIQSKYFPSNFYQGDEDYGEVYSEKIQTQTVKPQEDNSQQYLGKSRLTAKQIEEDNAACKIF